MTTPYLGEIRLMSFNFAPKGWALCNGQLLPILQNEALFSLLGTSFGGNGQNNFALPDLRGRVPIHAGGAASYGEYGGAVAHTLTLTQLPAHTHAVRVSSSADGGNAIPTGRFLGGGNNVYGAPESLTAMHPGSVGNAGGGQAHENRQPYLVLNFCIALQGVYPSPT